MIGFVARRLAIALPLALGAATLVSVLMESASGNAADLLLGDRPVPPEVRQRIERAYGLDRSPVERCVRWLGALFLRGEQGWSHACSRPVATVIRADESHSRRTSFQKRSESGGSRVPRRRS